MSNINLQKINEFLKSLANEGKSENTIESYYIDIKDYIQSYSELNRDNILSYKKQLKQLNKSATTINHRLSALKKYNLWLIETKQDSNIYVISNDMMKIQKQYASPTKINDKDVIDFYNQLQKEQNKRNIAIVYLILSTGIRRAECANIKINDIDFRDDKLIIRSGKGDKQRSVLLNSKVIEILKDYIDTDRNNYIYKHSPYLFISSKSKKIANETINAIMKPYGGDKITPHMLRHFWATNAYKKNMNLVEIANNLGHSSLQTTTIYTHPSEDEMRAKIENMMVI